MPYESKPNFVSNGLISVAGPIINVVPLSTIAEHPFGQISAFPTVTLKVENKYFYLKMNFFFQLFKIFKTYFFGLKLSVIQYRNGTW